MEWLLLALVVLHFLRKFRELYLEISSLTRTKENEDEDKRIPK